MGFKFKRKLIPIGQTSIGVIIPSGWLRYNNLGKGDRVEIIVNGDIIIKLRILERAKS